jgi:uncharacterized protein YbcI
MNQQREGPLSANAVISDAAVKLMREYTGRGPTRSRTTIDRDTVMIMLGDTLTRGEQKLVQDGRSDSVLQLRHEYQLTMRDDLVAAVEAATQRKVVAFMSQNHIDPDLAVEVFALEPNHQDGDAPTAG